jgi:hypothetical protein
MQDRTPTARRNHLQRTAGPYIRVTSDKTHIEHNESALILIADVPGDMDFRCNGPIADLLGLREAGSIKRYGIFWVGCAVEGSSGCEPLNAGGAQLARFMASL